MPEPVRASAGDQSARPAAKAGAGQGPALAQPWMPLQPSVPRGSAHPFRGKALAGPPGAHEPLRFECAHCDMDRVTHMCCTMCNFFAIFLNCLSGLTSHTRMAGEDASSRHPKAASGDRPLRTWCRELTKLRENQNVLSHKHFQKHFFLSPLCKSDLSFAEKIP